MKNQGGAFDLSDSGRLAATRWLGDPDAFPVTPPAVAATVMVLRDQGAGIEVFMQRRVRAAAFMPAALVFPGGRIDPDDANPVSWAGPDAEQWASRLGTEPELASQVVQGAVRELFEEAGVLLAGTADQPLLDFDCGGRWTAEREAVETHQLPFSEFLNANGLTIRTDLLHVRSRWVTPVFEPLRYDTWFFTAALPPGQLAHARTTEVDRYGWRIPGEVIDSGERGEVWLVSPTLANLKPLRDAANLDDALVDLPPEPILQQAYIDADGELQLDPWPVPGTN